METVIFQGKQFAAEREELLSKRIADLGFTPKLASLFFWEDPASIVYTNLKQAAAERVGIGFEAHEASLRDDLSQVIKIISKYAGDKNVHGLLVQKPEKAVAYERGGLNEEEYAAWWKRLAAEIPLGKDVDCLTPVNLDLVYRGEWRILPATVRAILSILDHLAGSLLARWIGMRGVVVGRSEIVGKPLAHVMAQRGAKVKLCGAEGVVALSRGSQLIEAQEPEDLAAATREADILVSATGKPGIITGDMVKRGAIVIDVGAPEGDVEFDEVKQKARFITPVPGGVGPVTVVSLLENLLRLI